MQIKLLPNFNQNSHNWLLGSMRSLTTISRLLSACSYSQHWHNQSSHSSITMTPDFVSVSARVCVGVSVHLHVLNPYNSGCDKSDTNDSAKGQSIIFKYTVIAPSHIHIAYWLSANNIILLPPGQKKPQKLTDMLCNALWNINRARWWLVYEEWTHERRQSLSKDREEYQSWSSLLLQTRSVIRADRETEAGREWGRHRVVRRGIRELGWDKKTGGKADKWEWGRNRERGYSPLIELILSYSTPDRIKLQHIFLR